MNDETKEQKPTKDATPWHDFMSKIFELAIGSMDHDRYISTQPPKIDVSLRQEEGGWTPQQRALLPDGIRDSTAKHILMEFKYTQSVNMDALHQAIGYAHFFRTTRKLKKADVQMFVLSSRTPQQATLDELGYEPTDVPGVYHSSNNYAKHIPLLVLNQLRDEPHNALVKIFASLKEEKAKAFLALQKMKGLPSELLIMLEVLWTLWSLPEGTSMNEVLTPERALEMGRQWKRFMFQQLNAEEADVYLSPEYKQTLVEQGIEKGIEKGREEGIEKGIVSTKQQTFMMILEHRFGEVSDVITEMITLVDDVDELDQWLNRALDAQALSDLWEKESRQDEVG